MFDDKPKGQLRLIRHILGTEIYQDEEGTEWLQDYERGCLIKNE